MPTGKGKAGGGKKRGGGQGAKAPAGDGIDATGVEFKVINEGSASILFPAEDQVFYNKVQILNRDLSIAVLRRFDALRRSDLLANGGRGLRKTLRRRAIAEAEAQGLPPPPPPPRDASPGEVPGMRILEALSASGLRSVRYWKEIPGLASILVNDIEPAAVESIRRNVLHNGLDPEKVVPHRGDAISVMHQHNTDRSRFDVVDLDPYGSPSIFLDAAVQSVVDGGLLCITCTDMGVLAGNSTEVCFAKYGAVALKSRACHELALRTVLANVDSHAARYKRYIKPLLSISVDFYIRMFVRVYHSPVEVKRAATKRSMVYQCVGCKSFTLQPMAKLQANGVPSAGTGPPVPTLCEQCGRTHQIGGPVWNQPIMDPEFVKGVLEELETSDLSPDAAAAVAEAEAKSQSGAEAGGAGGEATTPAMSISVPAPSAADVAMSVRTTSCVDAGSNSAATVAMSRARLTGLIRVMASELPDVPLYYSLPDLAGTMRTCCPRLPVLLQALHASGYRTSSTHCLDTGIKTDAPASAIWDIMRCWEKLHPVGAKHRDNSGTIVHQLLKQEPKLVYDFSGKTAPKGSAESVHKSGTGAGEGDGSEEAAGGAGGSGAASTGGAKKGERRKRKPRFVHNPEQFWGPKSRAKGAGADAGASESGDGESGGAAGSEAAPEKRPRRSATPPLASGEDA